MKLSKCYTVSETISLIERPNRNYVRPDLLAWVGNNDGFLHQPHNYTLYSLVHSDGDGGGGG